MADPILSPSTDRSSRILFVHGLEGSPTGTKARLLEQHFQSKAPAMDTGNFAACVEVQEQAIRDHKPDLVIGSSFGGAVVARCLERGSWKGPTLLLAAAVRRLDPELVLPRGVPVWIVHGLDDAVIDPEDSRHLAATGRPEDVRLIETNDDHSLHSWVKSGQFVDLVREILETRNG